MGWQDDRHPPRVTTLVRTRAHSDDAKQRSDESYGLRRRRLPGWPVLALVAVLLVAGVGGTAALVRRSVSSPGARIPDTSPRADGAKPSPGADSPGDARVEFDVRGTATSITDPGTSGIAVRRYPVTQVSFHLSCQGGSCSMDRVRAGGEQPSYIAMALSRRLAGSGPWSFRDPLPTSCAVLPMRSRGTLTVTGDRVGYDFVQYPYTGSDGCQLIGGHVVFTGARVG